MQPKKVPTDTLIAPFSVFSKWSMSSAQPGVETYFQILFMGM